MKDLTRTILSFWNSSIGKKILVALTGVALLLFLPGHLIGHLLVFAGQDAINGYALFLHELGHGAAIWIARLGVLGAFVIHLVLTIQLTATNRAARTQYAYPSTVQASISSRLMIWSGLTILAFVIYHLLHFTVRIGNEYNGESYFTTLPGHQGEVHNVYKMMIDGFSWAPASAFYIVALTLLCSHLSHGFASVFQTLGIRSRKTTEVIRKLGWTYALLVWLGFISIPISIWIFGYGS